MPCSTKSPFLRRLPHNCLRHIRAKKSLALGRIDFVEPHGDADAAVEGAPFSLGASRGRRGPFRGFGHGPTPFSGTMVKKIRLRRFLTAVGGKDGHRRGESGRAQAKMTRPGDGQRAVAGPWFRRSSSAPGCGFDPRVFLVARRFLRVGLGLGFVSSAAVGHHAPSFL